jgi:VanZ family protein
VSENYVSYFTYLIVGLVGAGILGLGWWVTLPVAFVWRWLTRGALAVVLLALLTPAWAMDVFQDWVRAWLPLAASASQASGADWVIHFCSFAVLGALLFLFRRDVSPIVMFVGLVLLGGVTEGLQYLVEGRTASVGDLVADSLGVGFGWLVAQGMTWRRTQS